MHQMREQLYGPQRAGNGGIGLRVYANSREYPSAQRFVHFMYNLILAFLRTNGSGLPWANILLKNPQRLYSMSIIVAVTETRCSQCADVVGAMLMIEFNCTNNVVCCYKDEFI